MSWFSLQTRTWRRAERSLTDLRSLSGIELKNWLTALSSRSLKAVNSKVTLTAQSVGEFYDSTFIERSSV